MKLPVYPRTKIFYERNKYLSKGLCSSWFKAESDSTDHFTFKCKDCNEVALVNQARVTNYNGYPELYLDLQCPSCNVCGTRKMWFGLPHQIGLARKEKEEKE